MVQLVVECRGAPLVERVMGRVSAQPRGWGQGMPHMLSEWDLWLTPVQPFGFLPNRALEVASTAGGVVAATCYAAVTLAREVLRKPPEAFLNAQHWPLALLLRRLSFLPGPRWFC